MGGYVRQLKGVDGRSGWIWEERRGWESKPASLYMSPNQSRPLPPARDSFAPGSRALALIHTRPGSALLFLAPPPSSGAPPGCFPCLIWKASEDDPHVWRCQTIASGTTYKPRALALSSPVRIRLPPRVIAVSPTLIAFISSSSFFSLTVLASLLRPPPFIAAPFNPSQPRSHSPSTTYPNIIRHIQPRANPCHRRGTNNHSAAL